MKVNAASVPLVTSSQTDAKTKAPRRARRGPLTRKQILDASLTLFSEKGFARTSVRDIARRAGITDAAIYYHFASKRELFESLFEERGITQRLSELEHAQVTQPPMEMLQGIATAALGIMQRNRDFMKVLLSEAMSEDPVASEDYRMVTERWSRAEAQILREFVRRGELPAIDVDLAARQLVMISVGSFMDDVMSGRDQDGTEPSEEQLQEVRSAVEQFVKGLQTTT